MLDGKFPKGSLCLLPERKPSSTDDRAALQAERKPNFGESSAGCKPEVTVIMSCLPWDL